MFDYQSAFQQSIDTVIKEDRYRIFADLQRTTEHFPEATFYDGNRKRQITIWCSNDYLGQGTNPKIINAACEALKAYGAGAGGTRNISGNTHGHELLERELAAFHQKENALIFTSGYVANEAAISAIVNAIDGCIIFSDEKNHASMIEGIRRSRAPKHIFRHNDMAHLEELLRQYPIEQPKIIIFESIYSMDGDFGAISDIVTLAKQYGALTYLDEVHAVGMYGKTGAGVAEALELADQIDVIQATLGKAIGCIGGYIAANRLLVDVIRSTASGFIFTTSLPPAVTAAALASIKDLRGPHGICLRTRHQERAAKLKQLLKDKNLPIMDTPTHIIPLMIGDAALCKEASRLLLDRFNIYIQPINYPTVSRGTERLRISPNPLHNDAMMARLVEALDLVWKELGLKHTQPVTKTMERIFAA